MQDHICLISIMRLMARLCQNAPVATAINKVPPIMAPRLLTETFLFSIPSFCFMVIISLYCLYQSLDANNKSVFLINHQESNARAGTIDDAGEAGTRKAETQTQSI
jgi:hypothetical protein